MLIHKFALFCSLVRPLVLASPAPIDHLKAAGVASPPVAVVPSQDGFYTAPAGFKSASPGTILRRRVAPGDLTALFNASSAAHQIVYRTTDAHYQPSWAVATLFVPVQSSSYSGHHALLSYQIPYNTADVDHSPSYALAFPSDLGNGLVLTDINAALENGWYVNVPDFEGPLAAFGVGVSEGHAVLDSIRAVLSSGLGLSATSSYALWGYSGGSIATEWAAELQVQYAPELNFSGMAIGGLVPNVSSIVRSIDGTPAAGLLPSLLVGLTRQYPDAFRMLVSKLKTSGPHNATGFLAVRNMSYFEAAAEFVNQSIRNDYFADGSSIFEEPVIRSIINSNGYMGNHGVPQMPVFLYKAVRDEYSPIQDTDVLVARYCKVGANIRYQRNTVGNHLDEYTNGDTPALDWLRAALNGSLPLQADCTIENVTISTSVHGSLAPP